MERDFMGLNSKESLVAVKEEINNDGCKDTGFSKGSVVQWPFSNKVSALPNLMSFKASQDDKTKMLPDSLSSAGFVTILSEDAFDNSQKRPASELQKSLNHNGQGGFHLSLTPYHVQHDVQSVNRPHDMKMFSVSNQAISVSMGHPFLKTHFATAAPNMAGASMKPQLPGGIPVAAPHSVLPTIGSVAGISEPCVKPSASATQLTIFYAGTVNVFDDISPEKAQAIMFLAGNGLSAASSMAQPIVQAPGLKLAATDSVPVNQSPNTPPGSGLSSPLSVSSHNAARSGSGSTSTEFLAAKTTGVPTTPVSKMEPPKVVNATTMLPSAVPQARKASLARFLEKRKERSVQGRTSVANNASRPLISRMMGPTKMVMSAAPYNLNKKSEESATAEYDGANFSASMHV